jgi:endoglucanase
MASEYDALTGTSTFAGEAQGWIDNVLGANPWGVSFTVGDGSTFPDCMQHQVANLMGSTNGSSPILAGAAVEGPANRASRGLVSGMVTCPPGGGDLYATFNGHGAVYKDNVQSYATNEPAIDLTAASPLAFAWLAAGS